MRHTVFVRVLSIFLVITLLLPAMAFAGGKGTQNAASAAVLANNTKEARAMALKTLDSVKKLKAGKDYVADEVIVQAPSEQEAKQIAGLYGAELVSYSSHGVAVLRLGGGRSVVQALGQNVKMLTSEPILSPNYLNEAYEAAPFTPTDPDIGKQYCHTDMDNFKAWDITKGARGVIVAVIDSGIDTDHPEFSGRISSAAYNSRDKKVGIAYVNDDNGHGSHVCGIIAAAQGNAKGGSGTAPGVTLLPIKANDPNAGSFKGDSIIEGIYYAADHGAKVLNMSLGRRYVYGGSVAEWNAIKYAVSKGVLVVCAAGNESDPHAGYPSAYPECIAVSALMQGKRFDDYYSNYGPEVDISAPGSAIYSCFPDKSYKALSGTSMASPQVAGVAALIRSAFPSLTVNQVRQKLLDTAVDVGDPGWDVFYGYGAVNSYRSLLQYTVTFNSQGGTAVSAVKAGYNSIISAPKSPTRASYHFVGWYRDAAYTKAWNFASDRVRANTVLYAKWVTNTVKVTFNSQGGSAVAAKSATYGTVISAPANPTRAGYTFAGWFREAACQKQWNFATDKVLDNITLYAKWNVITFTVTFNSQGGSAVSAVKVVQNALLTVPGQPARAGYTFLGWFRESACYSPWTFATDKVTANITLYAKWADTRFLPLNIIGLQQPLQSPYGVAVDGTGNVYATDYGGKRMLKISPTGALLASWDNLGFLETGLAAGPRGIALDSQGFVYIADITYNRVLKYSPDGILVKYWGSYGEGAGKFKYAHSVAVDSQGNVYVADNYAVQKFTSNGAFLLRWQMLEFHPYEQGIPRGIAVGKNDVIYVSEGHFTHVSEYDSDGTCLGYYLQRGDSNGQIRTPAGLDVDKDGNIFLTDTFSHRVQRFTSGFQYIAKWGTYGSGTDQFNQPNDIAVDGSGNLYVADLNNKRIMVQRSAQTKTYRVTYNSMGGSAVPYMLVDAGKKLIAPVAPTRAGYQFLGWYKESTCTNAWNFTADVLASNRTLYAKWKVQPAAPAGVQAASASYTSAKVSWSAAAGAVAYEVWRQPYGASAFTLVCTTSATSFTNAGLATGQKYYYRVRAYGMEGSAKAYGAWSATVSVIPVPATPTGVKAALATGAIKVSWAAVAGATAYEVYRSTSQSGSYGLVATTSALSCTNTGVKKGTTYYYKVRAYRLVSGAKVYGSFSAVVYAKA